MLLGIKPKSLAEGWYPDELSEPARQLVDDVYGEGGDPGKPTCKWMHKIYFKYLPDMRS